jgi:hypothetical protein
VGKGLLREFEELLTLRAELLKVLVRATVPSRAGCVRVVSEPEDLVCIFQAREEKEKEESTLIFTTCVRVVSELGSGALFVQVAERSRFHHAAQKREAIS